MPKNITKSGCKFKCMVKNKTDTEADLYFYGDIVMDKGYKWSTDDKCPADVIEALESLENIQTLNIYINSGGGSVFAGNAIYNRLKMHPAHKVVHIDGVAASIASVIALVGDEIIMPENTYIMIHKALSGVWGNSDDLRAAADRLEQIEESIVGVYEACTNDSITEDKIRELMAAETWFKASDAAEFFNNITVVESEKAAACITDMEYTNIPENFVFNAPDEEAKTKINEVSNILTITENFLFTEGEKEND